MKKSNLFFTILSTGLMLMVACGSPQKKKETDPQPRDEAVKQEYMKEGFLNDNLYRVVLVTPENQCRDGRNEIENRAKLRAQGSLRNLLMTRDGTLRPGANAEILHLINESGKLEIRRKGCPGSTIYNFDIAYPGLKSRLRQIKTGN